MYKKRFGSKMPNINDIMKQAQEMQKSMEKIHQEAAKEVVRATSGGGVVEVTASGDMRLKSIKIDANTVLDLEHPLEEQQINALQQCVLDSINYALEQMGIKVNEETSKAAGDVSANADIHTLMKQAQKAQQNMAKIREELAELVEDMVSPDNMITISITGNMKLKDIDINLHKIFNLNQGQITQDDKEMVQDLVVTAVNEVLNQVEQSINTAMGSITGGAFPGAF